MKDQSTDNIAVKASVNTIIINSALAAFKLAAGIISKSGAMVSDAVHSASDVLSTIVVIIGIKISHKESDKSHPYGHERMECVAALLLAVILCSTGILIGYQGIIKIISWEHEKLPVPGLLALFASVISIATKEAMYWYTRAIAKINSGAMLADAWHHRSDAFSSVGSFAGILGSRLGFPVLDSVASVIICIFIIKVSVDIFKDSVDKMTDKACDDAVVDKIKEITMMQKGVLGIDKIKTRQFGNKIYVDIEILADGSESLNETHAIAQTAHDAIEEYYPQIKHCMIHVNPVNLKNQAEKNKE